MGWKDRQWRIETTKLSDGDNSYVFMDEGEEVKSEYGEQVKFTVCTLDDKGTPSEEKYYLYVGSAVLLEALKKIPRLTAKKVVINKTGTGSDTRYTLKEAA